ncbi:MAG: hypothetical protein ACRD4O_10335, partial [Bryobacteraceae bacterium]
LEDIGKRAGLRDRRIAERKIAVANHYIRELIGVRNIPAARRMIHEIGIRSVSGDILAAAFSPAWVFRLRRRLRAGYSELTGSLSG